MADVTVKNAIRRGLIQVYSLFFPCIIGIPFIVFVLNLPDPVKGLSVLLGIGVAWLWWSYQVPRWRLWALQHVDNIIELHQQAVTVGIEWPYGSIFEYTEIKSQHLQLEETIYSLRYYLRNLHQFFDPKLDELSHQEYTAQVNRILPLLETTLRSDPVLRIALNDTEHFLHQWLIRQPYEHNGVRSFTLNSTLHFIHRLRRLVYKQAGVS